MEKPNRIITVKTLRVTPLMESQRECDEAYQRLRAKSKVRRRQKWDQMATGSMNGGCAAFLEWLARPGWDAARNGITIEHREVRVRHGRSTLHVMFKVENGGVLLHYWPGTGRAIVGDIVAGERHHVDSPDEAFELAVRTLNLKGAHCG
jgi:hypothetical protein